MIMNIHVALNTGDQQDPQEFNKLFMDQLEKIEQQGVAAAAANPHRHAAAASRSISSYTTGMILV